jgi:hypothetical protein
MDELGLSVGFLAHVRGNVNANRTGEVILNKNAVIDGDVSIVGAASVDPLHFEVIVQDITVDGNVLLLNNEPTVVIGADEIGGNLICFGNDAVSPFGAIAVGGQKLGECANI